jgi:hypothetical protein
MDNLESAFKNDTWQIESLEWDDLYEYLHQHSDQLFHCLIPLNPNGFRVSTAFIDDVEKHTENGHLRAEARWYEPGVIYACIRTVQGDMGDSWGFGMEKDEYVVALFSPTGECIQPFRDLMEDEVQWILFRHNIRSRRTNGNLESVYKKQLAKGAVSINPPKAFPPPNDRKYIETDTEQVLPPTKEDNWIKRIIKVFKS